MKYAFKWIDLGEIEGVALPWYITRAKTNFYFDQILVVPIPLHLIVRLWDKLLFKFYQAFRPTELEKMTRKAFNAGKNETRKLQEQEAFNAAYDAIGGSLLECSKTDSPEKAYDVAWKKYQEQRCLTPS